MVKEMRGTRSDQVEPALGLERILFFSDAVMAIAITLLAIDLKLPVASIAVLRSLEKRK